MSVAENLELIREKIKNYPQVNLIAVSKTIDSTKIIEAINADCKIFGENKVLEAKDKWVALKSQYPNVKLHLIGHLQSNKAKEAIEIFDVIQTLDSEKLAGELFKEMQKQKKFPEFFVQVNIGEEPQKSGIAPSLVKEFVADIKAKYNFNITGLMAIPPADEEPALYFALLKKIADENNLKNVSMGMSGDFETAIDMGSNYIRIGTLIFGERQ